jgi:hypothetical protein
MERLLVLRLEAVACSAEALLNGVPLARVDAARPARTLPVHEFTLAGANELELIVQPALPGAPEVTAPHLSDGKAWAGVRLLLPRVGQVAHPSNARTLAQIDWAVPDGEVYESPLHLLQTVDLKIAFPRWRWLDVPPSDDGVVDAAKPQAAQLLQRLAVSLARGDPDPFLKAARLRFEELALAYQRNLADEAGRWRLLVKALVAAGPFKPELVSLASLQLRKVAGGRLLECLAADGQPALRGVGADGARRHWPLRVASIEGSLHVLR